jgi:hypothetical protein
MQKLFDLKNSKVLIEALYIFFDSLNWLLFAMLFCLFNLTEYYINSNRSLRYAARLRSPPGERRARHSERDALPLRSPGRAASGQPNVGGSGSPGGYIFKKLEAYPVPGRQHAVFL